VGVLGQEVVAGCKTVINLEAVMARHHLVVGLFMQRLLSPQRRPKLYRPDTGYNAPHSPLYDRLNTSPPALLITQTAWMVIPRVRVPRTNCRGASERARTEPEPGSGA
jgi:hypothetical protein